MGTILPQGWAVPANRKATAPPAKARSRKQAPRKKYGLTSTGLLPPRSPTQRRLRPVRPPRVDPMKLYKQLVEQQLTLQQLLLPPQQQEQQEQQDQEQQDQEQQEQVSGTPGGDDTDGTASREEGGVYLTFARGKNGVAQGVAGDAGIFEGVSELQGSTAAAFRGAKEPTNALLQNHHQLAAFQSPRQQQPRPAAPPGLTGAPRSSHSWTFSIPRPAPRRLLFPKAAAKNAAAKAPQVAEALQEAEHNGDKAAEALQGARGSGKRAGSERQLQGGLRIKRGRSKGVARSVQKVGPSTSRHPGEAVIVAVSGGEEMGGGQGEGGAGAGARDLDRGKGTDDDYRIGSRSSENSNSDKNSTTTRPAMRRHTASSVRSGRMKVARVEAFVLPGVRITPTLRRNIICKVASCQRWRPRFANRLLPKYIRALDGPCTAFVLRHLSKLQPPAPAAALTGPRNDKQQQDLEVNITVSAAAQRAEAALAAAQRERASFELMVQAICASALPKLGTFSGSSLSRIAAALGELNPHPPHMHAFLAHHFQQQQQQLLIKSIATKTSSSRHVKSSSPVLTPFSSADLDEGCVLLSAFWRAWAASTEPLLQHVAHTPAPPPGSPAHAVLVPVSPQPQSSTTNPATLLQWQGSRCQTHALSPITSSFISSSLQGPLAALSSQLPALPGGRPSSEHQVLLLQRGGLKPTPLAALVLGLGKAGPPAVLSLTSAWRCTLWGALAASASRGEFRLGEVGDVLEGLALMAQILEASASQRQHFEVTLHQQTAYEAAASQGQQAMPARKYRGSGRQQEEQQGGHQGLGKQQQQMVEQQSDANRSFGCGNGDHSCCSAFEATASEALQLSGLVQQLCKLFKIQVHEQGTVPASARHLVAPLSALARATAQTSTLLPPSLMPGSASANSSSSSSDRRWRDHEGHVCDSQRRDNGPVSSSLGGGSCALSRGLIRSDVPSRGRGDVRTSDNSGACNGESSCSNSSSKNSSNSDSSSNGEGSMSTCVVSRHLDLSSDLGSGENESTGVLSGYSNPMNGTSNNDPLEHSSTVQSDLAHSAQLDLSFIDSWLSWYLSLTATLLGVQPSQHPASPQQPSPSSSPPFMSPQTVPNPPPPPTSPPTPSRFDPTASPQAHSSPDSTDSLLGGSTTDPNLGLNPHIGHTVDTGNTPFTSSPFPLEPTAGSARGTTSYFRWFHAAALLEGLAVLHASLRVLKGNNPREYVQQGLSGVWQGGVQQQQQQQQEQQQDQEQEQHHQEQQLEQHQKQHQQQQQEQHQEQQQEQQQQQHHQEQQSHQEQQHPQDPQQHDLQQQKKQGPQAQGFPFVPGPQPALFVLEGWIPQVALTALSPSSLFRPLPTATDHSSPARGSLHAHRAHHPLQHVLRVLRAALRLEAELQPWEVVRCFNMTLKATLRVMPSATGGDLAQLVGTVADWATSFGEATSNAPRISAPWQACFAVQLTRAARGIVQCTPEEMQAALAAAARLAPAIELPPACACNVLVRLLQAHTALGAAPVSDSMLPFRSQFDGAAVAASRQPAVNSVSGASSMSPAVKSNHNKSQHQDSGHGRTGRARAQGRELKEQQQQRFLWSLGEWLVGSGVLYLLGSKAALLLLQLQYPDAWQQLCVACGEQQLMDRANEVSRQMR